MWVEREREGGHVGREREKGDIWVEGGGGDLWVEREREEGHVGREREVHGTEQETDALTHAGGGGGERRRQRCRDGQKD